MDSEAFLIRGLGHRAEEIAARFFGRLGSTGIEGVKRSSGRLEMDVGDGKKDSRDYYFAERELGDEALATMAVRVAATGADLFVEWRRYTTPPVGPI